MEQVSNVWYWHWQQTLKHKVQTPTHRPSLVSTGVSSEGSKVMDLLTVYSVVLFDLDLLKVGKKHVVWPESSQNKNIKQNHTGLKTIPYSGYQHVF